MPRHPHERLLTVSLPLSFEASDSANGSERADSYRYPVYAAAGPCWHQLRSDGRPCLISTLSQSTRIPKVQEADGPRTLDLAFDQSVSLRAASANSHPAQVRRQTMAAFAGFIESLELIAACTRPASSIHWTCIANRPGSTPSTCERTLSNGRSADSIAIRRIRSISRFIRVPLDSWCADSSPT
jgi:hypothetical protein